MSRNSPVAIVGMALKTPGAANSHEFWQLIQNSSSTSTKIPESRFSSQNYAGVSSGRRTLEADTGNFLDDADQFDNDLFKISPREARMMDPQQRILLHVAYEALEDAGHVLHASPSSDPDHVGVYVGVATHDYVHNIREDFDIHYAPGTLAAFLSGRVSYALSLGGPSVVFDTACSSSGTAIHAAVRALQIGDCRMALAGGVNVITSPDLFIGLDAAHFLSRSGQSVPFDSAADGYSRSEGCGIFVLKRLEDALSENDRILGVIGAVEVNQSYGNSSITRTHAPAQAALVRRLLSVAGVKPEQVDVVEAHAAGTKLGDASELIALQTVFLDQPRDSPLYVCSVKASIGHLEAASGTASLAKALLMMYHDTIPQQPRIRQLNSAIDGVPSMQLAIPLMESVTWTRKPGTQPRYAVVNNYGAAGSNCSILLQEYVDPPGPSTTEASPNPTLVFGMSAPNQAALEQLRDRYATWLESSPHTPSLLDFCYTSTARRQQRDYRITFSTSSTDRRGFIEALMASPIVAADRRKPEVVFVYPGHGAQLAGMGQTLYESGGAFKETIDLCNAIVVDNGFPTFLPFLIGGVDAPVEEASAVEQLALLSFEVALSKLWASWGVSPSAVVGYSLGEYTALVTSGVLSLEHALLLVGERARLVQEMCLPNYSGMMVINLPRELLLQLVQNSPSFPDVVIACYNSETRHTVAGPLPQLESLKTLLEMDYGERAKLLPAMFGYHSPAMQPILKEFQDLMTGIAFERPSCIVSSTTTGSVLSSKEDSSLIGPHHLLRHCHDQVRFHEAIESLTAELDKTDTRISWIEVSPHRTLLSLIRSMRQPSHPPVFIDSMRRNVDPWATLAAGLSQLYMTTVDVKWRDVFASFGRPKCISLPAYPFQTRSFWVPYRDPSLTNQVSKSAASARLVPAAPPPLHTIVPPKSDDDGQRCAIQLSWDRITAFSEAHIVASTPICPASIFLEAVLTTFSASLPQQDLLGIRHLEFLRALIPSEGFFSPVQLALEDLADWEREFTISSQGDHGTEIYARGQCYAPDDSVFDQSRELTRAMDSIQSLTPGLERKLDMFTTRSIYDVIFPRVVKYSPCLQALDNMILSEDHSEAYAILQLPSLSRDDLSTPRTAITSPVYLDAMVHLPGFIVNLRAKEEDVFICAGIGALKIQPSAFGANAPSQPPYQIYSSVSSLTRDSFLAETIVLSSTKPSRIIARLKNILFKRVSRNVFASRRLSGHARTQLDTPPMSPAESTRLALPTSDECEPISLETILERSLLLPRGSVRAQSRLDALGLDSLTSIEILHVLKTQCGVKVPHGFLHEHTTVGGANEVLKRLMQGPTDPSTTLVRGCLHQLRRTVSTHPAICFIHDGTGTSVCYQRLMELGRDVWAIESPRGHEHGWETVEQMAALYADVLSGQFTSGVIVAGYSFGGVVAFEVAKQLKHRGLPVAGLLLLDAPPPSGAVRLSKSLINMVIRNEAISSAITLRARLEKHTEMLSRYRGTHFEGSPPCVFLRCRDAACVTADVEVDTWLTLRDDVAKTVEEWRMMLGGSMQVVDVPGHHFDMFDANRIESTSNAVVTASAILEDMDTDFGRR